MKEAEAKEALELALEFEAKPSLDEMIAQVSADYWTVVGGQHARLLEDMITRPMPEQVRRIAIYTALEAFLRQIKNNPAEVGRRLQRRGANAEA